MRTLAIVLAVIFLVLMVFYLIPGVNHPFTSGAPTATHVKHAVLFLALAVLCFIGARFVSSSTATR
ncbi:MAG: hypothetical protein JO247_03110 [Chloroflexi bacterium]|nr:hypothetical protein [Chloroflexota bacterium]